MPRPPKPPPLLEIELPERILDPEFVTDLPKVPLRPAESLLLLVRRPWNRTISLYEASGSNWIAKSSLDWPNRKKR